MAAASATTGALVQVDDPALRVVLGLASLVVFWGIGWVMPSPATKEPPL